MSKPSDFAEIFPSCSVSFDGVFEGIVRDLMKLLADTGDEWVLIDRKWLAAVEDTGTTLPNFIKCIQHDLFRYAQWCQDEESARSFSHDWANVPKTAFEDFTDEFEKKLVWSSRLPSHLLK
ncbi:MAG: hypothetical protein GY841_15850 [FCB group bacterium]|nr:hypothetical protein [FCB group bacterium]